MFIRHPRDVLSNLAWPIFDLAMAKTCETVLLARASLLAGSEARTPRVAIHSFSRKVEWLSVGGLSAFISIMVARVNRYISAI